MPQLFLYEPRMLVRSAIRTFLNDTNYSSLNVYPSLTPLIEELCGVEHCHAMVLVGVGGAGNDFAHLLKLLRSLKRLRIKAIAWLPEGFPYVVQLLRGIGVSHLLLEDELESGLMQAIRLNTSDEALSIRSISYHGHLRTISQTELDIMLQFANGLSAKEISSYRGCGYKTVFSWKHNLCAALGIQTPKHWIDALAEIAQISTLYQTR